MSRHQIPRHARKRLTIAAIAATALIGGTVTAGIMGIASAGEEGAISAEQCQVQEPPAEEPPAEQPPEEQPPQDGGEEQQPPAEDPGAGQGEEDGGAEQPPAEDPGAGQGEEDGGAEQPPAEDPGAGEGEENGGEEQQPPAQTYGVTAPQAAHPDNPVDGDENAEDPNAGDDQNAGEEQPPAEDPGDGQGEEQPPAEDPGDGQGEEQPPAEDPGDGQGEEQPPAEDPGNGEEQPPAEDPGEGEGDQVDPNCVGPFAEDFEDINNIQPAGNNEVQPGENASTGNISVDCGTNQENHNNPDNVNAAPGVRNGAEHTHDYFGNDSTDANSTNDSLAAAGTTCVNGDLSTYYIPVIRLRQADPTQDQADPENPHNIGTILHPASVDINFSGNAQSPVSPMAQFLQISTGDSKAFFERAGSGKDRAHWTCTGFEDRFSKDKYPLCPEGSQTERVLEFPSCWDGQNIDSADGKHIAFPDAQTGACPESNPVAVPKLTITSKFDIPPGQLFALDTFPKELHKPITDHGDFINVMNDEQMQQVVDAINGAAGGGDQGGDQGDDQQGDDQQGDQQGDDQQGEQEAPQQGQGG